MQQPNHNRRFHVSIAGNIGVGKSTLVQILAEEFGWQPYYELVSDHPYLDDYYGDRERWGFHSQIWFLTQRFEQHLEIADTPSSILEDRSMYEDYEIFVKGLLEEGILSQRDFRTYRRLYTTLVQRIQPPSLVVFLQASVPTLQRRIASRARPSEMNIPPAYLTRLNQRYDLTDALRAQSLRSPLTGMLNRSQRWDTGTPMGWLTAVVDIALTRPDIEPGFRAWLSQRLSD